MHYDRPCVKSLEIGGEEKANCDAGKVDAEYFDSRCSVFLVIGYLFPLVHPRRPITPR